MAAANESEKKSTIREYYEALLIAIVFINFARIFAFQAFKIPSGSMEDNLLTGDHIFVNKFIYGPKEPFASGLLPLRDPRRGDIVVFRYPEDPRTDFVKRVVGLPGETVTIREKRVFIDGRELAEPYVLFLDKRTFRANHPFATRDHFGPFRVPPGEYFTMGDNRDNSHDSRFWGTVPRAMIKGRAFIVYWSFELEGSPDNRLEEIGMVLRGFFANTRWRRTFFIVDRKYHYGNE
ncbi:MAG TPA: signal peptidase I [Thermoanaerobaculia bacterium]|jgi:signal peptidase I|nr:signal peptidase I [Thermoanaerobaculia bacterium]